MILIATILFIAALGYSVWADHKKEVLGQPVHTVAHTVIRCATLIPCLLLFALAADWNFFLEVFVVLFFMGFWFLSLFDLISNIVNKKPLLYNGADALTDKELGRISDKEEVLFKVGGIILFTSIYLASL